MSNKKSQNTLYFIALIPPEPVHEEVLTIKYYFEEKYNSKAALKSPPHITLYMPFRWKEEKEAKLFEVLKNFSTRHQRQLVEMKNFGAFEPRVIYIDVKENEKLEMLQKKLIKTLKKNLKIMDKGFEERPFRPHMTIAFRDLKKPMFWKAWKEEFKDKFYEASFTADKIVLLKHDGKKWQVYKNFPLEG